MTMSEIEQVQAEADCLYDEAEVEQILDTMATEISAVLSGSNPLVLCVMNGALVVTGKLLTRLQFPLQVDYIHASRYRDETVGTELKWIARPSVDLRGRTLLIVDDILDEGETLAQIQAHCLREQALKVYTAVLVNKKHGRKHSQFAKADFTGLETEDRYLFGYGMDYKGYLRNAAGIYALRS